MTGELAYAAFRPPFVTTGMAVPIMQSRAANSAQSLRDTLGRRN